MLNNAIEFCKAWDMREGCSRFAEQHSSLSDFWQHCENLNWMVSLLDATKYQNANKLWELVHRVEDQTKDRDLEYEHHRWQANRDKYLNVLEGKQNESEFMSRNDLREQISIYALVWAHYAISVAIREIYSHTMWDAGISAALQGKREEEIQRISKAAANDAATNSYKMLADLLREVCGNPFSPRHPDDFQ